MRKRIYEVIELAKEKDRLSAIYDSFMILVIVLSLLPLLYKVTPEPLLVLDKVCVGIFLVDYLLRWGGAACPLRSTPSRLWRWWI